MKKKIVILSAFVTPFRSGAEACSEEVSARLKDDFDITIVTARLRRDLPYLDHLPPTSPTPGPFPPISLRSGYGRQGGERGVRVWRVGLGYSIDKWLYPFLAPFAARALKPDIIHAVLESYAGLAMVLCKRLVPSAKRILTCQSTNTSFLVAAMHRAADHVTAISSVLVERAKQFGKDATLIPNGIRLDLIDEALSHRPKIDGRILYVGRLEPMKGVDTLLKAFAALQETRDPSTALRTGKKPSFASELRTGRQETHLCLVSCVLSLRIVGDGSERKHLEQLAHDLHISDRITFAGRVSPQKVAEEFAQAQIFCGLSRSEALGNVFLEAQAAECAVVATTVGGIPDIVKNEKTGLLIAPDNVEAAVEAIKRLVDDEALRAKLSENGRKHAENYDWGVIAEMYKEMYDTLATI